MRIVCLVMALLTFSFISYAQHEDSLMIRRIADEILMNSKAYDNLHYLTKQIGPRLAGSAGMVKAEQWGLKTMETSGADKAWLQECMVPNWVRGGRDEAGITSFIPTAEGIGKTKAEKKLDVVALGNSIGTGSKGIVDNVVLINSFDELEAKKDQVNGKIVFYNSNSIQLM